MKPVIAYKYVMLLRVYLKYDVGTLYNKLIKHKVVSEDFHEK